MEKGTKFITKLALCIIGVAIGMMLAEEMVLADSVTDTKTGIEFEKNMNSGDQPTKEAPKDNTPTVDKGLAFNEAIRLPQTGEIVKQLAIFIAGMIILTVVLSIALDRQIHKEHPDDLN